MNIGVAVYSMQAGGTERVVSILVNLWLEHGHTVSVFTFDNARADSFYALSSGIKLRKLGIASGTEARLTKAVSFVRKYHRFRKTVDRDRFDALVSFTSEINVLVLAAVAGLKVPVVVSERSDPSIIPESSVWRLLRRVFYHRLPAALVVQNRYAAGYFEGEVRAKIVAIPNPIETSADSGRSTGPDNGKLKIVAVGRLVKEKRHELLIRATHRLLSRDEEVDVALRIIGEGPMQDALRDTISELGMESSAELAGFCSNPWQGINPGDIYVQCSDFEGLPNALCEAMSRGCAVISTAYSPAVTEIIDHGINGILVRPNDVAELHAALRKLVGSPTLRNQYGVEARKIVRDRGVAEAGSKWIRVFEEVAAKA